MARALSTERANGAIKIEGGYQPPPEPLTDTSRPADDGFSKQLLALLEKLPTMIASAVKPPVINIPPPIVNIEAPKPLKLNQPPVYVSAPDVKVPATIVNVPEQKAPVVHVEPAVVQLSTQRPKEWVFDIKRNELGQITKIFAKAT